MLTRVYIHNYKCYVNFEQKFDSGFVFLSGRNGVGKTTLFDVFELLKKVSAKGESLEEIIELYNSKTRWLSGTSEQCFELDVENEEDKYAYTLVLDDDPTQDNLYRIKREVVELNGKRIFSFEKGDVTLYNDSYKEKSVTFHANWNKSFLAVVAERKENNKLIWFKNWLENVMVFAPNPWELSKNKISEKETFSLKKDLSNFSDWFRNVKQSADDEVYQQFTDDISDLIDGFGGMRVEPLAEKAKKILVTIKHGDEKQEYSIDELSSGQILLIGLYAVLHFCVKNKNAFFCFDEPENFLSLSEVLPFIESLFETSQEGKSQIFVTSHHPDVYSYCGIKSGIFLQRENNQHVRSFRLDKIAEKYPTLSISEVVRRGWEEE